MDIPSTKCQRPYEQNIFHTSARDINCSKNHGDVPACLPVCWRTTGAVLVKQCWCSAAGAVLVVQCWWRSQKYNHSNWCAAARCHNAAQPTSQQTDFRQRDGSSTNTPMNFHTSAGSHGDLKRIFRRHPISTDKCHQTSWWCIVATETIC